MSGIAYVSGLVAVLAGIMVAPGPAVAGERPIGDPVDKNGMEIAAVYLQPVKMDHAALTAGKKDVHLEADIHAAKGNRNGFGAGEWIPYLKIAYRIEKVGSNWSAHGLFGPMIASDGPHYGANIGLDGPGEYRLDYEISPPISMGLHRHIDKETGVGAWWTPFHVKWSFEYPG